MRKVSGSFTVEAAVIVPILLILLVITVDAAIGMYEESQNLFVRIEEKEWDVVELFYEKSEIGDWIKNGD